MESNAQMGVKLKQPKSFEERTAIAKTCATQLKYSMPLLVDTLDDRVGNLYSGMPARAYVIDVDGKVTYQGGRGPFGFRPGEMEQSLELQLFRERNVIMNWQLMSLVFCVLFLSHHSLACCPDDVDNGIASYFLQKSDMDEKLSVHIKATVISDISAKQGEGLGVAAINKYQRLVIAKQGTVQRPREFLFDNWKFGNDVDSELLDKAKFTPKLIQKQVDFDEIIERFELMSKTP